MIREVEKDVLLVDRSIELLNFNNLKNYIGEVEFNDFIGLLNSTECNLEEFDRRIEFYRGINVGKFRAHLLLTLRKDLSNHKKIMTPGLILRHTFFINLYMKGGTVEDKPIKGPFKNKDEELIKLVLRWICFNFKDVVLNSKNWSNFYFYENAYYTLIYIYYSYKLGILTKWLEEK